MVESFADIFKLQVRVCLQNLGLRHTFAHHPNDGSDRNAQSPNARNPSHLIGVYGDSVEMLHVMFLAGGYKVVP
jgi:hypothetical protein